MKVLFIVFALISFNVSFSQTFEFEYKTKQDDRLLNVFETEEGNVFCVGHIAEPLSTKYKGLILKLNAQGELIDQRIINIPDRVYDIYGILQDTIGSLVLYGKTCDTTDQQLNTKFEIKTIDYSLNVIDSASYLIDKDKRMGGVSGALSINGDLLFTGGLASDVPPPSTGVLIRLNRSLDSILFHLSHIGRIDQIRQKTDSTYWIVKSAGSYKFSILDSMFEIADWAKVPNFLAQVYGLKWDTDTSFFMAGEWNGGSDDDIGILRQHDPLNDEEYLFNSWGTEGVYDYPAPSGAIDFNNKDSVYIGVISPFYPWLNYPSNYVLLQTDSLLNIRWEKFYGDGEYYYELMRVFATNDGGCILAGTKYDFNSSIKERDIYLVKVDGEGLFVGNEETLSVKMHEALIYPNLGTTEIKVRIAAQYKECLFQLFDMNGKQAASEKITGK